MATPAGQLLVALSLFTASYPPQEPTGDAQSKLEFESTQALLDYLEATDDEALRSFHALHQTTRQPFEEWSISDGCLMEMVRRGGEGWKNYLEGVQSPSLEVLTASRRLAGLRDPLRVRVENEDLLDTQFPELPILQVRLQNVDEKGESFEITDGGNYRTGRLTRWRVEVVNEEGRSIGVRTSWLSGKGGGGQGRVTLEPGDMWGDRNMWRRIEALDEGGVEVEAPSPLPLPLRHYVDLPGPGRYTIVVQYHDHKTIAAAEDVRSLVLSQSESISFVWRPREVRLSDEDRTEIEALLTTLYTEEPVVLTRTPYSAEMEFEGEPASAAEALYRRGWQALPVLMDALDNEATDVRQRAWLLAMLSNITGLNEPGWGDDALGGFRMIGGPLVTGGSGGAFSGGLWGTDGGPSARGQQRLLDAWHRYRDLVKVIKGR